MAEVKSIKVGDEVLHYGTYSKVTALGTDDKGIVLTVQEDGRTANRTESPKTNLPVRGE